jgi:hypothetical protein
MKELDKQAPTVVNNFHAPIGQYVQYQHIEHMTIGSDGQIQVASSSQPSPQPEPTQQPSYTRHIETTASITAIGKLLVADANSAKTKAEFINKISEIVQRTQLFTFKPNTSNQEKADFTNAILAAYGYKGTKCANITDDDFQRYF